MNGFTVMLQLTIYTAAFLFVHFLYYTRSRCHMHNSLKCFLLQVFEDVEIISMFWFVKHRSVLELLKKHPVDLKDEQHTVFDRQTKIRKEQTKK